MSKFQVIDGRIGGQAIDVNSTTQEHQLGLCVKAIDTASTDYGVAEFIYAKGLASIAVGEVVVILPDDWSTKLAVANDVGMIGLAMAAIAASEFGWFQIYGKGVALSAASNADNAAQYLTATPGTVDDAVVAGDRVHNMVSASAVDTPTTGQSEMELNYPHVDNIAD